MPRKARRTKNEEEHAFISARVDQYDASVEASVNHAVYALQHAWDLDERDPLYKFTTRLTITGTITGPQDRAGHRCELTFYGGDAPSQNVHATLKDAQVHDKYGLPQYREYRGREIPVFKAPKGLATIEKVRGETLWRAWFFVLPKFVSEALLLLGTDKPLYLSIHERKQERTRWVQSISLQTSDPEEE